MSGRRAGKSLVARAQMEALHGKTYEEILESLGGTYSSAAPAEKSVLTREHIDKMIEQMKTISPPARITGARSDFVWYDEAEKVDPEEFRRMMSVNYPSQRFEGADDMAIGKGPKNIKQPLSPEAVLALENLANQMSQRLAATSGQDRRVTLAGPGNMTVTGPSGYRKRNHLGGEEFTMIDVRVGSPRNGYPLIFAMKPTSVADYSHMEMSQTECEANLNDWRSAVDRAAGGNFYVELEKVRTIDHAKVIEQERQRMAGDYQEFGAW